MGPRVKFFWALGDPGLLVKETKNMVTNLSILVIMIFLPQIC